jgi:hypothetical protein
VMFYLLLRNGGTYMLFICIPSQNEAVRCSSGSEIYQRQIPDEPLNWNWSTFQTLATILTWNNFGMAELGCGSRRRRLSVSGYDVGRDGGETH